MGVGVNIPVLSGDCTFSDGDLSVAYEAVFDGADIRREERTFTSEEMHSYLSLEIIMLLGIIQVVRKKEEIV